MNPALNAALLSWPMRLDLMIALGLPAGVYLRGWYFLRRNDDRHWHGGQPAAFLGGLMAIFLALASPIESFSGFFLQIHMVQHLLLMMVAPPLIWLGDPLIPLLKGLPVPIRTFWIAPWFRWSALRNLFRKVSHPISAGTIYVTAATVWHLPIPYEIALGSDNWHYAQHLTFLGAGSLFWFPVVQPYPFRPRWSRWLLVPVLICADVQNTVLSALLTFSDRVVYPHYAQMPRLDGSSALDDQASAGAIMWLFGSLLYLIPLFSILVRSLLGNDMLAGSGKSALRTRRSAGQISLPLLTRSSAPGPRPIHRGFDLLGVPFIGAFLRWRYARFCFQIPLLLLAGVMIYDGLYGPAMTQMNLAGVLPWIHWRGLLMLGLLIVGNVFCMACPFMLPRLLARRMFWQRYHWPRRLRNKWLALIPLGGFLWAYDAFALWNSPWCTAWIALGYFLSALVIDSFFRGAAFCKYICPIGQFNFVQSLLSPWEIEARNPTICAKCRTKDCLRGNATTRGCELDLFVPRKSGNMDCTLCLDCVRACPHDNIGLIAGPPAASLWHDRQRSGIGRFARRPDIAALVLVVVFGAFANAAGMVGSVVEWQQRFAWQVVGIRSPLWITTAYYLLTLVVLPVLVVGAAGWLSRHWARRTTSTLEVAVRYAFALAPLGFAMWLAHACFHLFTSYETVVPIAQRFAVDLGVTSLGKPAWGLACCRPVADWLLPLEIIFLDLGLLVSLFTGYRMALLQTARPTLALKSLAPWAVLMLLLFAAGIWILCQPMQMRGTL